jgi:hypothetical protein
MALPLIPPADGKNHITWPDGTHDVAFSWDPRVSQSVEVKTKLMHFDGRTWPLAYFQEHSDEEFEVDFLVDKVNDGDQFGNLRALVDGAYSRTTLVWTSVFGDQFNCIVTTDPVTREFVLGGVPTSVSGRPLGGRFQRVKFKVTRVE